MTRSKSFLKVLLAVLFITMVQSCMDKKCESCNTFENGANIKELCNACALGYTLNSQDVCVTDQALIIGIAIAASAAIVSQCICFFFCRLYLKKINKKHTEITLEQIYEEKKKEKRKEKHGSYSEGGQQSDQSDTQSIKSEFKLYITHSCYLCKKDQTNTKTTCGHYFHIDCLKEKLMKNYQNCPRCSSRVFSPISLICELCYAKDRMMSIQNKKSVEILKKYKCTACRLREEQEERQSKWYRRCWCC